MCRVQICPKPELALKIKQGYKVRYPKYSKHGLYTVAHTINWVCYKILNRGLNPGLLFSLFQVFWMKRHFEWTWKFRIEIQIPVLFNILVLLDVQANLPKTMLSDAWKLHRLLHFYFPFLKFKCISFHSDLHITYRDVRTDFCQATPALILLNQLFWEGWSFAT